MRRLLVTLVILVAACSGDATGTERESGVATSAPVVVTTDPPPAATRPEVRFVSQNILHGISCPADSRLCELEARVELFTSQLSAAGCPEMVSLQEANGRVLDAVVTHPAAGCAYTIVWDGDEGLDRELVLTTLDVSGSRRIRLAGGFRTAYLVRVDSPLGVVDFVTTHLASTADNGECDDITCPPPCRPADQLRSCQARQVVAWARELAVDGGIIVLGGDMNATIDDPTVDVVTATGFIDSHGAAGRDECDRASGSNCTAGRSGTSLADLTDPTSVQRERIDFLFQRADDRECVVGSETGLFNPEPAPGELAFPSDHTGVILSLECLTDEGHRAAVSGATLGPDQVPGLEPPPGRPDPATAAAITSAFETFFDGSITDLDLRLAQLEVGASVRDTFVAQFASAGELATSTTARIDSVSVSSATSAVVTYTILVSGNVVFDRIPGAAVRVDGRWLMTRETYCDVALLGGSSAVEPCQ